MCKLQTNPLGTQIRNAKYVNLTNANAKPTTNKEDPSSFEPTSEENNQTYSFTVLSFKMTKINLGSDAKKVDERTARGEMYHGSGDPQKVQSLMPGAMCPPILGNICIPQDHHHMSVHQ